LLREVELWCEYAREELGTAYPQEALRALWHQALTLQFHDILPGSSIQKVYEDSKSTYARLFEQAEALLGTAQRALTQEDSESLTLWNSLSRSRDDVVRFAAPEGVTALADAQGHQFPVQRLSDGSCVAFVQGLAPLSAVTLRFVRGPLQPFEALADASGFDTPLFCGRFDENMRIVSLIDRRTGRETVQPGHALNRLVVYDNRPHRYDAWDVNIYYPEKQWTLEHPESVEIVEQGPVLTAVRVRHRFGTSSIVQDMVFYHDLARIDFQTTVSWREAHGLLKRISRWMFSVTAPPLISNTAMSAVPPTATPAGMRHALRYVRISGWISVNPASAWLFSTTANTAVPCMTMTWRSHCSNPPPIPTQPPIRNNMCLPMRSAPIRATGAARACLTRRMR
jgi:alpha-mannosidase